MDRSRLWFHRWLWLKMLAITIVILLMSNVIVFTISSKTWLSEEDAVIRHFTGLDYTEVISGNFESSFIRNKIGLLG